MAAIQTGGFQVRAMPVYTAPNPSLVAFNPAAAGDGMMQAFQLARQYEELKAKKALQAELEATRAGRIASQNSLAGLDVARVNQANELMGRETAAKAAGYDATARIAMPRVEHELFKMGEEARTMPQVNDALINNAGFQIASNDALRGGLLDWAKAKQLQDRAAQVDAQQAIDLAPLVKGAKESDLKFRTTTSDLGRITAPLQAQLDAFRLGDAMGNAGQDAATARESKRLQQELIKSQIQENLAQAEYNLGLGRQASGRVETPIERAKKLQALIKELDTMKVGDGITLLGVYKANTYNDDGTVKGDKWFGAQPNATVDEVGDFYLKQRKVYQDELMKLQKEFGTPTAASRPGLPSNSAKSNQPARFVKDKDGKWVPKQ